MSTIDLARRTPTLPSLTGLRWLAAIVVFAFHISIAGWFSGKGQTWMTDLFGAGATGVSMFFVLSGFVLAWSHRPGTDPLTFWRRRLSRVYPLHLVAVLLALLVSATLVPQIRTDDPMALLANVFLVSSWKSAWWQAGNPVSWSLVCEAFFYLVFPLVIVGVRKLSRVPLIAAVLLVAASTFAVPAFAGALPEGMVWSSSPATRLPEFLLGVLLAVLMRRGEWAGARLAPALAVSVFGYYMAHSLAGTPYSLSSCTVVGFALLVSALARADIEGRRTGLTGRSVQHLGALSFPFYLVHVLTLQSVSSLWPNRMPQLAALPAAGLTVVTLLLALGVAQLLHMLVEVPARRLILAGPRRVSPSPAAGASPVSVDGTGKNTRTLKPSGVPGVNSNSAR